MTRADFDKELAAIGGKPDDVSNEDFESIATVHTYHPAINRNEGMKPVAQLFYFFGMTVINDMLPRAQQIEDLSKDLELKKTEVETITEKLEYLKGQKF